MQKTLFLCCLTMMLGCKKDDLVKRDNETTTYTVDYHCTDLPMTIGLHTANYTDEEMDTVIVRRYEGDGSFSQLIDTNLVIVAPDTGQYPKGYFAAVQDDVFGDSSDYEIVIPGAGQAYRIWNIKAVNAINTITYKTGEAEGHYRCEEPVKDFDISGGNYVREISYPANGFHYHIVLKH